MQLKLIDPKSNSSCFVVAQPREMRWTTMTTMNHYLATMTTTFWLVNNRYEDGAKVVLFFHNGSFYRFFSSYFFQYSQSTVSPLGIDTLLDTQKVMKKPNYFQQNWISKFPQINCQLPLCGTTGSLEKTPVDWHASKHKKRGINLLILLFRLRAAVNLSCRAIRELLGNISIAFDFYKKFMCNILPQTLQTKSNIKEADIRLAAEVRHCV